MKRTHRKIQLGLGRFITTALAIAAGLALAPLARASTWSTSAQFGEYNFGNGYKVNNDVWGSGAGSQTLFVDTLSGNAPHFWVSCTHPHGSGNIKAYPDARITIGKTITSLTRLVGQFDVGSPPDNVSVYDWAFDCWIPSEVMVWTKWDRQGVAGTLYQSNVSISGVTYNVYHGSYWTFRRVTQTSTGMADLAGIFKWLYNRGLVPNGTVGSCQFGVEIVDGSTSFAVHSCSITQ